MFEVNFNKLLQDIVSDDSETQCLALESAGNLIGTLVDQAIKGFETSKSPMLMAERLANLGTIVVSRLETFIESSKSGEARTLASILLLQLGSRKGLSDVIDEFREQGKHEFLAVMKLVEARIPKTGDLIIERLRKFSLEEFQNPSKSIYINNLISYLVDLNISLPHDIKSSFEKIRHSPVYKYYSLPD